MADFGNRGNHGQPRGNYSKCYSLTQRNNPGRSGYQERNMNHPSMAMPRHPTFQNPQSLPPPPYHPNYQNQPLLPHPKSFTPGGASNTGTMQVTLSFTPPGSTPHTTHDIPSDCGPGPNMFEPPPPYTLNPLPFSQEGGPTGWGRGVTKMRGNFSQSCDNLNSFSMGSSKSSGSRISKGNVNHQNQGRHHQSFFDSNKDEGENSDDSEKSTSNRSEKSYSFRGRGHYQSKTTWPGRGGNGKGEDTDRGGKRNCSRHRKGRGRKQSGQGVTANTVNSPGEKSAPNNDVKTDSKQAKGERKSTEYKVFFHIRKNFENPKALRLQIESAMNQSEKDKCEFSIEEIRIQHQTEEAKCKLTIFRRNFLAAKSFVRKMANVLKQELKVPIHFDFNDPGQVEGKSKANANIPNLDTDVQADKAKNKDQGTSRNEKSSMHPKMTKAKASNQAGSQVNNASAAPVPTAVSFVIKKCFLSTKTFIRYLEEATSALTFKIQVDPASVCLSDDDSKCLIQTNSKADAKRLLQCLKIFQERTDEQMTFSSQKYNSCSQSNSTKKESILSHMAAQREELLLSHEDKITGILKEFYNSNSSKKSNLETEDSAAIQEKVNEAKKQSSIFLSITKKFIDRIERLDFSSATDKGISSIKFLFENECKRFGEALPIYAYKEDIVKLVISNQVSIIVGRNGCGKSTQVAQYLLDAGFASDGIIVCSQSQHLTVEKVAQKVAADLSTKVGTLVGVKTPMGTRANKSTKILFATDQILLDDFRDDNIRKKFSCIIIDEASEHTMYTDLLMGLIKSYLPGNQNWKVIIIAADIETQLFQAYFETNAVLKVSDKHFGIEVFYSDEKMKGFEDYKVKVVSKVCEIHAKEGKGDILVFLGLIDETLRCCQEFEKRSKGEKDFQCIALHCNSPPEQFDKALKNPLKGERKVIFATSYAENCTAINGVRFVIDSGFTSQLKFDIHQKVNVVTPVEISQSMADVRKHCAGLNTGGKCYRLYTRESFEALSSQQAPEIIRVHLEKAILKLLALGVDLNDFHFFKAPSRMALDNSQKILEHYGAISHDGAITDLGKVLSNLPFDPIVGSMINECMTENNDFLYDVVVLSAIIASGSDLSYQGFHETKADARARNQEIFGLDEMGPVEWFQVFKEWNAVSKADQAKWCHSKYVNYKLINSICRQVKVVKRILLENLNIEFSANFSSKVNVLDYLKELHERFKYPQFSLY